MSNELKKQEFQTNVMFRDQKWKLKIILTETFLRTPKANDSRDSEHAVINMEI